MKAQTKAILASLVVIAVALSAVSGVTYSWWSDSENTDITVGTGNLDVTVDENSIKYSSKDGSSGFFQTQDETANESVYENSGSVAKLSFIKGLTNVAPGDEYYIEYDVTFKTTVYAKYIVDVISTENWVNAKVEIISQEAVGETNLVKQDIVLNDWQNLPSGALEQGKTYYSHASVKITLNISHDVEMNEEATVNIVNEITQKANGSGPLTVTSQNNVVTGTTGGDDPVAIKATFSGLGEGEYIFTSSAIEGSYGAGYAVGNRVLTFELKDSNGQDAEFDSVVIEVTIPGLITANVIDDTEDFTDDPSDISVFGDVVTFTAYHFSDYVVVGTTFNVSDDTLLAGALDIIKNNDIFWNVPVTINLSTGTYSGNHVVYQYPEWTGGYLAAPSANFTNLSIVGIGAVEFTGQLLINGAYNAVSTNKNDTSAIGNASTLIKDVDFDGSSIVPVKGDVYSVILSAASSGVTFDGCSFENMTHVILGEGGNNRAGFVYLNDCVVNASLSGYYIGLEVSGSKIQNINNQTGGDVKVYDCEISVTHADEVKEDKSRYVFRSNSGVVFEISDSTIDTNGYIAVIRGNNSHVMIDNCELSGDYTPVHVIGGSSTWDISLTINDVSYWCGLIPDVKPDTMVIDKDNDVISINDARAFAFLGKLSDDTIWNSLVGESRWKYTVELNSHIDLCNFPWTPVTLLNLVAFEGNDCTIYNLHVDIDGDNAGLFSSVKCNDTGHTDVRDLNIIGAIVSGGKSIGVVAGSSPQGVISNVHVEDFFVSGTKYVGGIFGSGNGSVNDSSVKDGYVFVNDDGIENGLEHKEAGGLIGYLSNDGISSVVDKVISGNIVENVTVSAPTVASGLVSQPNSSNVGGAMIVIKNNCLKGVTVITADDSASFFVSNNVNGKTSVIDNICDDKCEIIIEMNHTGVFDNDSLDSAIEGGADSIFLPAGDFVIPDSAQGKTLTIKGNGETVIATQDDGSYEGCDYSLDGSTVTFEGIVINTDSTTYTGYARMSGTYNNCIINGTYTLYGDSVFNNCVFNVSGDVYNIWTWGAPTATFNNCTFNSDGKALLLYGQANTKLVVDGCTFNDNGGLTDKKAAIEIGNDYNKSYELIVNDTVVNGYEINDKGINTGTTLWGNKNSMGTDKLNVVVDGVDVY